VSSRDGRGQAIVVWFCGLPGSGKSTIARGVYERINRPNRSGKSFEKVTLVEMDAIRKKIFPNPTYSDQERDAAYRSFVLLASILSQNNVSVLLDATGHKRIWRDLARQECPNFAEVYIKCPIEICIQRETNRLQDKDLIKKKLYLESLERLRTGAKIEGLGRVPGVDEPFEESASPEVVIDSSKESPQRLIEKALQALNKFDPELFYIDK
jgi:adenylylsulfate kinase